ncbi:MAG: hypothetical protein K6E30_06145 [Lachnospiraceae bacterium]|nr:hypothetical protein [Lachnospiraceae bacterium]
MANDEKMKKSRARRRAAGAAGGGVILLAILFGLGGGIGGGLFAAGQGNAGNAESGKGGAAAAPIESEKSAESVSMEVLVRVHNMEVYVNEVLCETDEEILSAIEEQYLDGMELVLVDDYADNEAYTHVEELLAGNAYGDFKETKK